MTKKEFKEARKALELSMAQMGEALGGYSASTVASWEYGQSAVPKAVARLIAVMLLLKP